MAFQPPKWAQDFPIFLISDLTLATMWRQWLGPFNRGLHETDIKDQQLSCTRGAEIVRVAKRGERMPTNSSMKSGSQINSKSLPEE